MFNTEWIKQYIKNGSTYNKGFIPGESFKYAVSTPEALNKQKESCKRNYKEEKSDACITAAKDLIDKIHSHL